MTSFAPVSGGLYDSGVEDQEKAWYENISMKGLHAGFAVEVCIQLVGDWSQCDCPFSKELRLKDYEAGLFGHTMSSTITQTASDFQKALEKMSQHSQ